MDQGHAVANESLDLASVELQAAMREGNQVIFDNVLPKLKKLLESPQLRETGQNIPVNPGLDWDKQTLSEEQTLVQPLELLTYHQSL